MPVPLLETKGLTAFYGDFQALFGIDATIAEGDTVAVIGANGAGKSTFLRAVTGLNRAAPNAVRFRGAPIGGQPPERIVGLGVAMVPEGRRLFPSLSVEENLRMGALARRKGPWGLSRVYRLFPMLEERRRSPPTQLSGGQQQMVAIGRALMANPTLLLCDEVSLGLAPIVIHEVYESLRSIAAEGTTVLVVEQDIGRALSAAGSIYCFQEGRVALSGKSAALTRDSIAQAYFGL